MEKKKIIISIGILCIPIILVISILVHRSLFAQPEIIRIPNGHEFRSAISQHGNSVSYDEHFIIVNPPRSVGAMRRLITAFNASNPIVPTHQPPDYVEYVISYARIFFRLSNIFARDFVFTDDFTSDDAKCIEGNAVFDRVAVIIGNESGTIYRLTPGSRSEGRGIWRGPSPGRHDVRIVSPPDPTLNGLFYHIPYHQIPPFGRLCD